MTRRRAARLLTTLCAVALAIPSAAAAQDYDLDVDPDSPSGREYALPIDRARHDAAGQASAPTRAGGGGSQAPLFGVGIGDADRPSDANTARRGSERSASKGVRIPAAKPGSAALQAQVPTPSSGTGQILAIGGAGAAILLAGGLIGALMRRRRTD